MSRFSDEPTREDLDGCDTFLCADCRQRQPISEQVQVPDALSICEACARDAEQDATDAAAREEIR